MSCTGPDDADILFGTCDWGNHSVTTISDKYIADHRAGNARELNFEEAREARDSGVQATSQAAGPTAQSELEVELAKLPEDEREQLLSAVKAANAQRDADAATTTGNVPPEPEAPLDFELGGPSEDPRDISETGTFDKNDPRRPSAQAGS